MSCHNFLLLSPEIQRNRPQLRHCRAVDMGNHCKSRSASKSLFGVFYDRLVRSIDLEKKVRQKVFCFQASKVLNIRGKQFHNLVDINLSDEEKEPSTPPARSSGPPTSISLKRAFGIEEVSWKCAVKNEKHPMWCLCCITLVDWLIDDFYPGCSINQAINRSIDWWLIPWLFNQSSNQSVVLAVGCWIAVFALHWFGCVMEFVFVAE